MENQLDPNAVHLSPMNKLAELEAIVTPSTFELLLHAYTSLKKEKNRLLIENNRLMGEIHKLKRLNNESEN